DADQGGAARRAYDRQHLGRRVRGPQPVRARVLVEERQVLRRERWREGVGPDVDRREPVAVDEPEAEQRQPALDARRPALDDGPVLAARLQALRRPPATVVRPE